MKTLERHYLSEIAGDMEQEEFHALIDSIDEQGILEPIMLWEGKILDGWHRYQACLELNIKKFPVREYEGDDPAAYVYAKDLRKHRSTQQRAIFIAKLVDWNGKFGRPSKVIDGAKIGSGEPITIDKAAESAGVSRESMKRAKSIVAKGTPEVLAAVESGEMGLEEAAALVKQEPEQQREAVKAKREPKPKKKAVESVPLDVFKSLQGEYENLQSNYQALSHEMQAVEAFRKNDSVAEMMRLQDQIAILTKARDEWQNKCAEAMRQIKYLEKQLKK
jgi:ParB-like chromosome segregation protein Spo0J